MGTALCIAFSLANAQSSPSSAAATVAVPAAVPVSAPSSAPPPCESAEYHSFDFWRGEWDVFTPDGKLAGSNKIERRYHGCVVHERYTTPRPYAGESLNAYDSSRKMWHQTWMDNIGTVLLLDGGMQGKSMVLLGNGVDNEGQAIRHRITCTPQADGTVRQHWESSNAKGEWSTAFDGKYVRRTGKK